MACDAERPVPERADTRGLLAWLRHETGGFDRESLQWLLATLGVIASVTGVFQFILPSTSFWLGPWAILLMAGVGVRRRRDLPPGPPTDRHWPSSDRCGHKRVAAWCTA
jgi:hypothetical protein